MRLVCPNCGAQYDVPLEVIPEAGRDVQCSNCGNTWFQKRVTQVPAERVRRPSVAAAPTAPAPAPEPERAPEPDPEPDPEPAPAPEQDPAPKRSIDPEMAELFREEREFEARRRAAETLETQPDLGLVPPDEDEKARRSRESRDRMARMRGETPAATPAAAKPAPIPNLDAPELQAAAAASRRGLLPDVEEINQTLRATSEPRVIDRRASKPGADLRPRETGSPFARGFMLTVLLAVLLVAAYALEPKIVETVPQAGPLLDAYTETVDKGRLWLDETVTDLLTRLDSLSSEARTPAEPTGD